MLEKSLNFLFPKKCTICKNEGKYDLCFECFALLKEVHQQQCPFCLSNICHPLCLIKNLQFKSCFIYNKYSSQIIKDLKYNSKTENAHLIAQLIFQKFFYIFNEAAIILPVNTSFITQVKRKYNVPSLILFYLYRIFKSKNIKIESAPYAIIRKYKSESQVGLSREDRIYNMRTSFYIKDKYKSKFKGKDLIILDDVITTGATILSCATCLQEFLPSKITALSFAQVFP